MHKIIRSLSSRGKSKVVPRSAGRFEELGIGSEEYAKLLKVFAEFDINDDGKLGNERACDFFPLHSLSNTHAQYITDLDEFLTNMQMKSRFVVRCFRLFDKDKNYNLDIDEFVLCVWNYCTLDTNSLIAFTFYLLDEESRGYVKLNEIQALVYDIFGDDADVKNKNAKRILSKLKQKLKTADDEQLMYESHANRFGSKWMPIADENDKNNVKAWCDPSTGEVIKGKTRPDTEGGVLQIYGDEMYGSCYVLKHVALE